MNQYGLHRLYMFFEQCFDKRSTLRKCINTCTLEESDKNGDEKKDGIQL